jgi:hypothetical protein
MLFCSKRKDVPKKYVVLLQILDALKDIKKIPDTTPDEVITTIKEFIKSLEKQKQKKLVAYALAYPPPCQSGGWCYF